MEPGERAQAEDAIRQLVDQEGYETLRLTISNDRHVVLTLDADPGPITLDDCTFMNHAIRRTLERAELPADDYAVEVESPGTRRLLLRLRHFERFVGETVRIRLAHPTSDGSRVLRGKIASTGEDHVVIRPEAGSPWKLPLDEIAEARLDPRP